MNKIAIYGLSTETERVLIEWDGKYNVIGLLDGFKTAGEQFGYPILDINNVVKLDNVSIIVVARPGSCKAIAKKIGKICKENNVPLFDVRGNDLLVDKRVAYDFKSVIGYTKADIMDRTNQVEAVSFDLFDTLIVRTVLSSNDVISLVNVRLAERNIVIDNFVERRINAEKQLSQGRAPRLCNIYERLVDDLENIQFSASELAELEYEVDVGLMQPRKEMVALFQEINRNGKKVYITSESYYSKEQISEILVKIGINSVDGLLISCEYDTGKTGELFDRLIDTVASKNILHIGDDIVADIESAKRHDIQAFQIYSASELLDSIGGLNLINDEMSLSDRIRVGMFIANLFNSPFQFKDEEKRIHVKDVYDIGYLFAAPMIMDFTKWFGEQVQKFDLHNIWFCARDGYLIQKLCQMIYPNLESEYFLTSRISAIRTGMDAISDVEYVDSMKFSGDVLENLKTRFGIDDNILALHQVNENRQGLLRYAELIMSISRVKKANAQKYIQRLGIKDGGIALFDFVAKGTSQMYIQKLIENKIKGLYFLQLEPEFMRDKNLDILPYYKEEEKSNSAIFNDYYILETLLTAPYPSLVEYDTDGNPLYAKETRTEKDIECFMRAQEGIIDYVKRYLSICPQDEIYQNKKLDEAFLLLIHNVEIDDKNFISLTVEDPFFNRMTDITDVL